MSRDDTDNSDDVPEPLPIERTDGSTELDLRATFQVLFYDPAVRNFTFTALGALGMIFLILSQQGSDIGGVLIVIVGTCGILFRWFASPVFVVIILSYFMIFPVGTPWEAYQSKSEISEGRFRVTDVMLVFSLLVYLACQYRIYGFVSQAVPFEGLVRRKGETPARRPPALIRTTELGVLLGVCAALVLLGQLLWWFANAIEVVPTEDFPLRWVDINPSLADDALPGGMSTGTTRFVLIIGFLFFSTLLARLVFGYWRLRMMGPAEGGMILLNGGWTETSRERQRQETWRIWGRKRARSQTNNTKKDPTGSKT
jgi:hypothetical protein